MFVADGMVGFLWHLAGEVHYKRVYGMTGMWSTLPYLGGSVGVWLLLFHLGFITLVLQVLCAPVAGLEEVVSGVCG